MPNLKDRSGNEDAADRPDRYGRPPECPQCGSAEVIPIVYGFPGHRMLEKAKRGQIALGGCVISGDDPQWQCSSCRHSWGGFDPEPSAE